MALQSTVASIQNIRKQRQLEVELGELDKKWHVELKVIARERLSLVKELCRINQDLRHVDHFHDSVRGKALTRFADRAQRRLLQEKELKEVHKFDFQPDPVEKMNLHHHLPLIREEGGGGGGMGQGDGVMTTTTMTTVTAKDLYKQRVQLRKSNSEQCAAERRNRRRPFWDKAIIGSRKAESSSSRNPFFRPHRGGVLGPGSGLALGLGLAYPSPAVTSSQRSSNGAEEEEEEEGEWEGEELVRRRPALSKSPSLPALHSIHSRGDITHFRPDAVHPSLSNRHSASLGYLPVIKTANATARGRQQQQQQGALSTFKPAASLSSVAGLPTIVET
ncbi:uncharacterized protein LOC143283357 [Babylonia areolata]|uniref:uncharacterized protein LOC143283357 n=1 Tax=Babylonia areolata TaxID=304850 RepID=UPI003FD49AE9